jgi:hypothetical protein
MAEKSENSLFKKRKGETQSFFRSVKIHRETGAQTNAACWPSDGYQCGFKRGSRLRGEITLMLEAGRNWARISNSKSWRNRLGGENYFLFRIFFKKTTV